MAKRLRKFRGKIKTKDVKGTVRGEPARWTDVTLTALSFYLIFVRVFYDDNRVLFLRYKTIPNSRGLQGRDNEIVLKDGEIREEIRSGQNRGFKYNSDALTAAKEYVLILNGFKGNMKKLDDESKTGKAESMELSPKERGCLIVFGIVVTVVVLAMT